MGGRAYLVAFHRPGDAGELARVRRLVSRASELSGVKLEAAEVEEVSSRPLAGCCVAYLSPVRGRHWQRLCAACGRHVPTPPPELVASLLAARAEELGAGEVLVVATWGPRPSRLVELDAEKVAAALSEAGFGVRVVVGSHPDPLGREPVCSEGCLVAPLALARGLLTRVVEERCREWGCASAGPLLDYGFESLARWLALQVLEHLDYVHSDPQPPRPLAH